jgi:hypothetical protein
MKFHIFQQIREILINIVHINPHAKRDGQRSHSRELFKNCRITHLAVFRNVFHFYLSVCPFTRRSDRITDATVTISAIIFAGDSDCAKSASRPRRSGAKLYTRRKFAARLPKLARRGRAGKSARLGGWRGRTAHATAMEEGNWDRGRGKGEKGRNVIRAEKDECPR